MNAVEDVKQYSKRVIQFSDVADIAASGHSTGKIETNKSIHGLLFYATSAAGVPLTRAQFLVDVDTIVIRADGVVIRELTAEQILDLYKHYKDDSVAFTVEGVLPLEFAPNAFDLGQLNNLYALGMVRRMDNGELKQIALTYEINYKAGLVTVDRIQVRAVVDDRVMEFGRHIRIVPHTRTNSATGLQDITDLPYANKKRIMAYHFDLGSGVVSHITVKVGDSEVYSLVPREVIELLLNNAGRKAQSGYFHIPLGLGNDPREGLQAGPSMSYLLIQPTWSTAVSGSFTILEESEYDGLS